MMYNYLVQKSLEEQMTMVFRPMVKISRRGTCGPSGCATAVVGGMQWITIASFPSSSTLVHTGVC